MRRAPWLFAPLASPAATAPRPPRRRADTGWLRATLAAGLVLGLAGGCAPAPGKGKLYVSNVLNATVSVLDAQTGEMLKKIPVDSLPHNFALSPDERYLFVTNSGSQNLSVIDTQTDTVVREVLTAPIPQNAAHAQVAGIDQATSCKTCHVDPRGAFPMGIGLVPKTQELLVTNFKGSELARFDPKTFALLGRVPLKYPQQPFPVNMAFSPTRDEVYVVSKDMKKVPGRLTVLDSQLKPKFERTVIKAPFGMLVSPDGNELYIASRITNKVEVYDTNTWQLKRTLISGDGPVGLHLTANGKLYTGNFYTNRPAFVSVLDAQTGKTLKEIPGVSDITRMATDPEGQRLYVVNSGANRIQIIDLKTDTVTGEIAAGAFPVDIFYKRI